MLEDRSAFMVFTAAFTVALTRPYAGTVVLVPQPQTTIVMRTATFLAFALLAATTFAQSESELISARLNATVRAEASQLLGTNYIVTCSVAQFNQASSGAGSALVMYSPASVVIDARIELFRVGTQEVIATRLIRGTSRKCVDEAVEDLVDEALDALEADILSASAIAQAREIAYRR